MIDPEDIHSLLWPLHPSNFEPEKARWWHRKAEWAEWRREVERRWEKVVQVLVDEAHSQEYRDSQDSQVREALAELLNWRDNICEDSSGRSHWAVAREVLGKEGADGAVARERNSPLCQRKLALEAQIAELESRRPQ